MPGAQPRRVTAKKGSGARAGTAIAPAVAAAFGAVNGASVPRASVPTTLATKRRERAQRRIVEALEAAGSGKVAKDVVVEVETLAREWGERGFDDGFEKAAAFEQRCFEEGEIARARRGGNGSDLFAAMETKHRAAVVRDFGKIEIRGLQMSARVYQDLDVAYVPLWVQD